VAILNPQAIPYWIFVLAYLKSSTNAIHLESWNFALFLIGACGGQVTSYLTLYCHLSEYIKKQSGQSGSVREQRALGRLLIVVGFDSGDLLFFLLIDEQLKGPVSRPFHTKMNTDD
jgi:hypothetical protein